MSIYGCIDKCYSCGHQKWYTDLSPVDLTSHLSEVYGEAVCEIYMRPYAKWSKLGGCEGATHVKRVATTEQRARVGQQKQRKVKK